MVEKKEETKLTAETFAADSPELYAEITEKAKAEGEKEGGNAEKERFSQIRELAKDDPAFVVEQFAAGKSVEDAKTALIERVRGQRDRAVETAKTKSGAEKTVDPAEQEFSDKQTEPDKSEDEPVTDKERFTKEFNESKEIQTEFGGKNGLDDYIAFREKEEEGLARTSNRGR